MNCRFLLQNLLAVFIAHSLLSAGHALAGPSSDDWPVYLGGNDSGQYSKLSQITRENVAQLDVAWVYETKSKGQIQCNPIIIDGVLYGSSPRLNIFALDAATGEKLWNFVPSGKGRGSVNRGVSYWESEGEKRILFSAMSTLYALDASSGKPIRSFGAKGRVDLKKGLGRNVDRLFVVPTTPGIVYKNLLIVGTRVGENLPAAPGHIRAYNIRTGALAWIFHTIPQPGELGYDTWPKDAYTSAGGANCWAGMSVDAERGIVYVPTGSAAFDFYGGNRAGDNLFANTLLALKAATGEWIWHYQVVRHDLWDRDLPAPPNLVTVEHDGKRIDAVAQITKGAQVFLFDRETGKPLFPIEEVEAPPSDLAGEWTAKTQPVSRKAAPFKRQTFTEEEVTDLTPDAHEAVLARLKRSRHGQPFIPPSREGTVLFPGMDGGGEWGGVAADPDAGFLYINQSEMPWMIQMVEVKSVGGRYTLDPGKKVYVTNCMYCHGANGEGDPLGEFPGLTGLDAKYTRGELKRALPGRHEDIPGFRPPTKHEWNQILDYLYEPRQESKAGDMKFALTGYTRFLDPNGYPAIKPPWGTLSAVDLNKGEVVWQVPLGELPELTARGIPKTGTEMYGGPIVTTSGLIFVGATKDEMFRAIDKDTGKILWEHRLPAGGYATPSTYAVDGKQYVVIAAGGGKMGTKPGNSYVAFALPQ